MNEEYVINRSWQRFKEIAERERLLRAEVCVSAKPLTAEEAIGAPGRRDFPIIVGKERVIEAIVLGAKGHAFTDSPQEFAGSLQDVLRLELTTNQSRAIYVATLNATLRHLGTVEATVHCKDDDPEKCAVEIASLLCKRYGQVQIGFIGLNPAIAERLADTFGAGNVRIADLNAANVGQWRFGMEIWDGNTCTDELIDASDVVLFTGTSLVNGTFDRIWSRIQRRGKDYLVYGVTGAGVCQLLGIDRICPRGRNA